MVDERALKKPHRRRPRAGTPPEPAGARAASRLRSKGRPSRIRPRSNASRKKSDSRRKSWSSEKLEEQKKVQDKALKRKRARPRNRPRQRRQQKRPQPRRPPPTRRRRRRRRRTRPRPPRRPPKKRRGSRARRNCGAVSKPRNAATPCATAMRPAAGTTRSSRSITRAWIKPASARPGVTCIVSVSQVPGGEVTAVRVNSCSVDDAALRQSVENAVYSASPLPPPPDPALFERNLELTFAPK